jgi:hypothetical protein
MCGIMAMGLLYGLTLWLMCVCGGGGGFGSNGFVTKMQPFPDHYRTNLISGIGHWRLDSVMPLVLSTVYCAMAGAPALYYKSLKTAPTLLRMGNISSRPCFILI